MPPVQGCRRADATEPKATGVWSEERWSACADCPALSVPTGVSAAARSKLPGSIGFQVGVPAAAIRGVKHALHDFRIAARSPEVFHQKSERARDDGRGEAGALYPVYVAASRAIGVGQEASHGTRGGKAVVRPQCLAASQLDGRGPHRLE